MVDIKKQKEIKTEKKHAEQENWHEKYLRALADYHNLERRNSQQISNAITNANHHLLIKIIELVDDLEKAELFNNDPGLVIIKNKTINILNSENVNVIIINAGDEFDPYVAECIDVVAGETENKVVEIIKKGYKLNGQILRPAQVRVSKKS